MRIFIPGKTSLYIEKGQKTLQFLILFLVRFHPWVWYHFPSVSFSYLTKGNGNTDHNNFEMIVSLQLFMKKLEIVDRWSTRISPAPT